MLFEAKLNHLRISPRKVRLVTNLIKGLSVKQAEIQLKFLTKRSAIPVLKLLNSAVANAKDNGNSSKDNLFVINTKVDVGPTLKRWRPRAMGRASAIMKRTSHITLTLSQKEQSIVKEDKKEEKIKPIKKDETLLEEIGKEAKEEKEISEKERKNFDKKSHSKKSKEKSTSSQSLRSVKKTFRRKSF